MSPKTKALHKSVVIFGAQGVGKTKNAEAFRKHFKMDKVVDDWDTSKPAEKFGVLYLTNDDLTASKTRRIYSFANAIKEIT